MKAKIVQSSVLNGGLGPMTMKECSVKEQDPGDRTFLLLWWRELGSDEVRVRVQIKSGPGLYTDVSDALAVDVLHAVALHDPSIKIRSPDSRLAQLWVGFYGNEFVLSEIRGPAESASDTLTFKYRGYDVVLTRHLENWSARIDLTVGGARLLYNCEATESVKEAWHKLRLFLFELQDKEKAARDAKVVADLKG